MNFKDSQIRGIAIMGLNGSGKSTLAHALAKRTGRFEMDTEDYYFPEQRASRAWALEHEGAAPEQSEIPYSNSRTEAEVERAMLEDIKAHPAFILSGVTMKWCEEILSRIDVVFLIQAPLEERLRRIRSREEKRFGARALPGGDMFARQEAFRKKVQSRDPKAVEENAKRLGCPVVVLDGTLPIEKNLNKMMEYLKTARQPDTAESAPKV